MRTRDAIRLSLQRQAPLLLQVELLVQAHPKIQAEVAVEAHLVMQLGLGLAVQAPFVACQAARPAG